MAATSHRLAIERVIAAASGAILGDNLGFWVGREGDYRLLHRYGRYIHLDERRIKLGQYLFRKHGTKVVFFGHYIAALRSWPEPILCRERPSCCTTRWEAGRYHLDTLYCLGSYFLGNNVYRLTELIGPATIVLGLLGKQKCCDLRWHAHAGLTAGPGVQMTFALPVKTRN